MSNVASTNRRVPPANTKVPSRISGVLFANRCCQPSCTSGASRMPSSPDNCRGRMPTNASSRPLMRWSTNSMKASTGTTAHMTTKALPRAA